MKMKIVLSAYDSEYCEEDEFDDVEILSNFPQGLESSTSSNSLVFGSFASPIIPVSIPSITPDFDGFSIKIGEITCFLGDFCCNDNQSSVQAFSSPIKVKFKHDGNFRFSQDQDQNSKKGEILSDLLLLSPESITFISHHRALGITISHVEFALFLEFLEDCTWKLE
ncbi:hypothetical protein L195_g044582, partial [Trifolium pratense]